MSHGTNREPRWEQSLKVALLAAALLFLAAGWLSRARVSAQSLPEAVEAINKARVTTRIMFVTAHPDDEQAGLLAYLSRGLDADVALLTVTRGQGGQNALGPEQNGELGVIRTTELLAADSHYGVRQYFTRAVDTGFSKSPERTMKIWGTTLPMEDMVRAIRTYRPDVVINGWGGVRNGHGQHQATGILTPQAVEAAADPAKFPEQIAEGLPAWKVRLVVRPIGFGPPPAAEGAQPPTGRGGAPAGTGAQQAPQQTPQAPRQQPPAQDPRALSLPSTDVSPLWGTSYNQLGAEGHDEHRSQGTPALFGAGFFRRPAVLIPEDPKAPKIDARELNQSITSLAAHYASLQSDMAQPLQSTDDALAAAVKSMLALDRVAAANSIAQAGQQLADLRAKVAAHNGDDTGAALWELDRVRERIDHALDEVVAPTIALNADRHELVAGEGFNVDLSFPDKPAAPVQWTVDADSLEVPRGWKVTVAETKPGSNTYKFAIAIPADATAPTSPGDAILPWPPPLAKLSLHTKLNGYEFRVEKIVENSETKTTGIATYPLELVPAVTLIVEPQQVMAPIQHAQAPVELLARVSYHATKPAQVSVGIDAPEGWKVSSVAPLQASMPGDQLVRYMVTPPAKTAIAAYPLHPYAKIGDTEFRTSLQPIPTLPTRDFSESADAEVHVLNLNVPAGLRIGYIDANSDLLPEALRRVGVQVDMLDEVALAFGDLSRYDAIVVGLRAYELRPDVMRANPRLLDYAQHGGTLLVQYQRDFAWNKLKPGPYPAEMAIGGTRVTDAQSPVTLLAPQDALLTTPNKISLDDFQGWVQERGIYFWDKWDPHYTPLIGLTDQGEAETKSALMYTRYGKGLYIYTGLVFFRELPAGVPGAYRLFVNLLSQTRHAPAK